MVCDLLRPSFRPGWQSRHIPVVPWCACVWTVVAETLLTYLICMNSSIYYLQFGNSDNCLVKTGPKMLIILKQSCYQILPTSFYQLNWSKNGLKKYNYNTSHCNGDKCDIFSTKYPLKFMKILLEALIDFIMPQPPIFIYFLNNKLNTVIIFYWNRYSSKVQVFSNPQILRS